MEICSLSILLIISMLFFVQVFVVSLLCMYLFLFLGMSKVETLPLRQWEAKKCGFCLSFLTDLDPYSGCNKGGFS